MKRIAFQFNSKRLGQAFFDELVDMGYDPHSSFDQVKHDNKYIVTNFGGFNKKIGFDHATVAPVKFQLESQWKDALQWAKDQIIKKGDYIVANYHSGNRVRKGQVAKVFDKFHYDYLDGFRESNQQNFKGCRLATPEEIKEALVAEAKRRGFVKGVKIDNTNLGYDISSAPVDYNNYTYQSSHDRLLLDGIYIYKKGKWAEIVDDKPLTFFDWDVEELDDHKFKIGCTVVSRSFLEKVGSYLSELDNGTTVSDIKDELEKLDIDTLPF